jgi:outer membrane protein TolC
MYKVRWKMLKISKQFKYGILLLLVAGILPSFALTLEQAMNEALQHNHGLRISANKAKQGENQRILGYTSLLPTVDATAGVSQSWNNDLAAFNPVAGARNGGDSEALTQNAQIGLNWILFDGFRMFRALELVHTNADLGNLQNKTQIESTALQVIMAYYNLVLQQSMLSVREEQFSISTGRLQRMEQKEAIGAAGQRELLSAQVALNADASALELQARQVEQASDALALLLGRQSEEVLAVEQVIDVPAFTMAREEVQELALQRNTTVLSMQQQIEMSRQNLGIKKSTYWPMVIASGSYGYSNVNTDYTQYNPVINTTMESLQGRVGISLNWNLFNGLNDKVNVQNAQLDLQNAQLQLEQYTLQLKNLVRQKHKELEFHYKNIEFDKKALTLASQNMTVNQGLFEMGKITDVQFRDAQVSYSQAAYRLQSTLFQARVALAELEQLIGKMQL